MSEIETSIETILKAIDKNPSREGLQDTPKRDAKFIQEFTSPPEFTPTTFQSEGYNEMIVQDNIAFYSLCEHHLLPFFGTGTIAYIPNERIIGLSKLARTLEHFSRRLQNQERITEQVAEYLQDILKPKGVGVVLTARHLCMEMRGVSKPNVCTSTSTLRGIFKTNPRTRSEFLNLKKSNNP